MKKFTVEFPDSHYDAVELEEGTNLSEELDAVNSPLLFGCRSGICGTCLIEVEEHGNNHLEVPSDLEQEALEIYAPDNPKARLACQLNITVNLKVKKIDCEE